ncbi:hypothetical protein J437_LFUL012532 [Ladona fulva]|uniref:F-box domain-containing protein n=1 Tax=Ladona fulva TaxID=123851 RepID=A0A8K0KC20_LADFU|nr:hypothetical protein J437_LFUL012532 [Ladona fulva]
MADQCNNIIENKTNLFGERHYDCVRVEEITMVEFLDLPLIVLEKIFSYLSYDEISRCRIICKRIDVVCKKLLTMGFLNVEKYHAQCLKAVKAQLPRRESERRNHSLSRHCDILTAIETRLSMLAMTFMKYVDIGLCCFIPGKVIDEIYRVLWSVQKSKCLPRAHEMLLELRDISSMAMEHFDEKIVPDLKHTLGLITQRGSKTGNCCLNFPEAEVTKQNSKISKQNAKIKRQEAKLLDHASQLAELRKHIEEYDQKFADLAAELSRARGIDVPSTRELPTLSSNTIAAPLEVESVSKKLTAIADDVFACTSAVSVQSEDSSIDVQAGTSPNENSNKRKDPIDCCSTSGKRIKL